MRNGYGYTIWTFFDHPEKPRFSICSKYPAVSVGICSDEPCSPSGNFKLPPLQALRYNLQSVETGQRGRLARFHDLSERIGMKLPPSCSEFTVDQITKRPLMATPAHTLKVLS